MSVPGEARGAALTALYRLHEAAGLPIPSPDWAGRLRDAVLGAAAPHIAAAERERIAQLAEKVSATYYLIGPEGGYRPREPFAALIREEG